FDETSSSKVSDRKGTTHKPEKYGQRGRAQQLPAMQEEGSMDEQFTPAPAASKSQKPEVNFGKRAAASKPAPRPTWHDDEDVSSVDSELEDDPPPRPPPKPEPKQKKGLLGLMQAPEEEEEPARQKRPPATAPVARQPEPDLADMKSALFGKTAVAAMAASKAGQPTSPEKARSVGSGSRGPAAAKPASSKRAALGASSKAPTSLPEPEGRGALPTKPAGSKGTSNTAVNGFDDDDTSALSTTPQPASVRPPKLEPGSDTLSRKPSHAAAKPPMPTTSRRGAFGREAAAGSEDEASIVSASTANQASGQRSQLAAAAAPGASSGGELQQVMSENSQLKAQLQQSLQTEVVLRQQLDQAEVTIRNLNKRIAEVDVDPAELYQQMQELEVKHKTAMAKALADREAALQQLEAKAQAQLADANRMLDQSMVAAVKNQQERKALQEEVERLKQQLASQPARQDDDLVEELQEQVAALQKESEVAQQAAAQLLEDVHGLLDEAGVAVPALEGMDALASLNPSVMALCKAFQVKAVDVEDLQQRVLQLADTDDTSKVSELETQLAHVTQLNSKMQEALQQSQQECSELQQQVARIPTDIPELALDSRPAPEADQAQLVVAMARRDELSCGHGRRCRGAGPTSRPGSRLAVRRGLKELSDDDDSPVSSLAARKADKERAALQLELSAVRGQCDKLEAVCADQKTRAAAERAGLERQLAECYGWHLGPAWQAWVWMLLLPPQPPWSGAIHFCARTHIATPHAPTRHVLHVGSGVGTQGPPSVRWLCDTAGWLVTYSLTQAWCRHAHPGLQAPVEAPGSGQMLAELQDQASDHTLTGLSCSRPAVSTSTATLLRQALDLRALRLYGS
ncbi:C2 NT-type domain-containing protein, partial [Haematococcus lacustris]